MAVGQLILIPDGEVAIPVARRAPSGGGGGSSGPSYVGYYLRPIAGGVKTQGLHGYNGIDIGARSGTPILAAASGRVIVSRLGGWNGGYGNYLVIEHPNGTQTLYSHNSINLAAVGQWVEQGETIATVGATGRATGPHLHFEVRGAKNPF